MTEKKKPPFRADHVGSLLRPKKIREAFKEFDSGKIDKDEFIGIQDESIKEAIKLQEDLGLQSVTDGEFRRASYWSSFVERVEGLDVGNSRFTFQDQKGEKNPFTAPIVKGKLSRVSSIAGDEFSFLNKNTQQTAKITIVSPPTMHMFRLDETMPKDIYATREEYFSDLSKVYREEITDLETAGCKYIQLDDVPIPMLSDPNIQQKVSEDGIKPSSLMSSYISLFNECIRGTSSDVTVAIHMCRGNYKGKFLSTGGYEEFAETFFNELTADAYFLEYDTPRSGDFSPLSYVPKGKIIVLGLVSSKTPETQTQQDIIQKIEEAAKFIDIEQLALSPQCGFASTVAGNPISLEDQKAKLAMVVEVAEKVWG